MYKMMLHPWAILGGSLGDPWVGFGPESAKGVRRWGNPSRPPPPSARPYSRLNKESSEDTVAPLCE